MIDANTAPTRTPDSLSVADTTSVRGPMTPHPVIARSRTGGRCRLDLESDDRGMTLVAAHPVRIERDVLLDAWLSILQQAVRREHAGQRADHLQEIARELQASANRVQLRPVA